MATDYGGAFSGHGAQPPQPARPRRTRNLALAVLVLGAVGFLASAAGAATRVLPRSFTAAQRQQITDWEYGARWRTLTAAAVFPASVGYPPPALLPAARSLKLTARRIGIAGQASCAAAADTTAARLLDRDGCTAMLRASYVDGTDSYVVTVGAAVLPTASAAASAARSVSQVAGPDGLGSTVRAVSFQATPAAGFTARRRQLSGVVSAGPYVVLYTVGYADSRPREPVARDKYTAGEMTSAGQGVANAVLSVLAAPVPPPHCPGTPGC
ncbi:MAG TPA: hypothetical protein VGD91_03515 [Trebonia sp.]